MICDPNLRTLCVIAAAVALIHAAPANMLAQVTGGTISGTVTDSSGKVVPNVRISIVNLATGVGREVTTNDDGVSLNDYANGAPGSVLGGSLGVDAIQEFSVITSNYSAEYDKTSGGVVNAITRSGTSQIHGTAYEFLRNSQLDAKNYFDTGSIPPFKRNQ